MIAHREREPEAVPVHELAGRLGVHPSTIYRMIREGSLLAIRLRRRVLIPKPVADRLLAGGPQGAAA